ncbi:MAG: hypothetical protein ACOH15_02535 [Acetobacterium sp.]
MKLTLLELIIKGIPEAGIFTLGIYAFSKTKVNLKKYLPAALLIFILTAFIRLLPINYGVNMMIILMCAIFISVNLLKIQLFPTVKAILINAVAVVLGEGLNFLLLQVTYGSQRTLEIIGNPVLKTINTIPSTIIFGIIVVTVYYFNVIRAKENKNADIDKEYINSHMQ